MIITCNACNTSFNLDDRMLKPTGSKVRCSVCKHMFTAFPLQPTLDTADEKVMSEPESTRETEAVDEGGATLIASLDDSDLDLDLGPENDPGNDTATVIADLDDDDLDLSLDGLPDGDETLIADLDDEELDLDGELSFDDEESVESATVASDGATPTSLEDLDDLDLTLDLEDADDSKTGTVDDSSMLEDDLDLSSLEGLLKDDDEDAEDSTALAGAKPVTLEPDLDMDRDPAAIRADAADESEETLEALEFDLDADADLDTPDPDAADVDDQEIDLSEIEKMLEEPEGKEAEFSSVPEQDLQLDIEASLETEKWMAGSGDNQSLVKDEELDLSELEQVLDDVEIDQPDDALEDPELELDLGEGQDAGVATETVAVDRDLDFDLSDFEDDVPPKTGSKTANGETVDMELEFEVEEDSQAKRTLEDERLEETVALAEPKPKKSDPVPAQPFKTAVPPRPAPVKRGISKTLIFLLIIAILGGGGAATYYLLQKNGIDIPFFSDYLKPKVQDPGNLKLTTYDINSRFVENANVGKLFVITGQVKNGYAENRGMITLEGKIYSTGKVVVNQEQVYAGNVMSDLELANLEWDRIRARLSNRLGDNRSNVKIEPGASIPFMVVFSGLPDDLEEFTIEVTGSTPLK